MMDSPAPPAPPTQIFVGAVLAAISSLWALSFILMKRLAADTPPLALAALRGAVAAAAIALFCLATRRALRWTRRDLAPVLVVGALHGWMPTALTGYALTGLGAGLAAMLQTATPLMTAALSHVALAGERLDARRGLGLAIGFLGVGLLVGPEAIVGSRGETLCVVAILGSSFVYALGNIYIRRMPPTPPERLALGQYVAASLVGAALALSFETRPFASAPTHWPEVLAFGAVTSALPFTLFVMLIQRAGPVRAAMAGYLVPILTVALAIAFLGESVALRQIVAAAIILAGVALVSATPRA